MEPLVQASASTEATAQASASTEATVQASASTEATAQASTNRQPAIQTSTNMEPTARTSAINFEPTVLTENTSRLSTTKELTSKICEKPGEKSSVEAGAVDDFSKISNSRELASVQHKTRRYRAQRRLTAFLRSKNIQVRSVPPHRAHPLQEHPGTPSHRPCAAAYAS